MPVARMIKPYLVRQVVIYTIVVVGFVSQSYLVCNEYMKYPTTTAVTIVKALPLTNFPQVLFCTPLPDKEWTEQFVRLWRAIKYANATYGHPWGEPKVVGFQVRRNKRSSCDSESDSQIEKCPALDEVTSLQHFVLDEEICFSVKTRQPLNMTPKELFINPTFHSLRFVIKITPPIYCNVTDDPDYAYAIRMVPFSAKHDIPLLTAAEVHAVTNNDTYRIELSFSQKVTHLLSPPYDTNCRDYQEDRFISQNDCFKICLDKWTVNSHQLLFVDHVLTREKLLSYMSQKDELTPIYAYLKDDDMTVDFLQKTAIEYRKVVNAANSSDASAANDDTWAKYWERMVTIFPDLRKKIDDCNKLCSQSDCTTEYLMPYVKHSSTDDRMNNEKNFTKIMLWLFPPREPVVIVTSKEKLILIDFIVYILSCLSFWFGFCPLSMTLQGWEQRTTSLVSRVRSSFQLSPNNRKVVSVTGNELQLRRLVNRRAGRITSPNSRITWRNSC